MPIPFWSLFLDIDDDIMYAAELALVLVEVCLIYFFHSSSRYYNQHKFNYFFRYTSVWSQLMIVEVEVVFEFIYATFKAFIALQFGRRGLRPFSMFTTSNIFDTVYLYGPSGEAVSLCLSSALLLVVIIIDIVILIIFASGAERHCHRALSLLTRRWCMPILFYLLLLLLLLLLCVGLMTVTVSLYMESPCLVLPRNLFLVRHVDSSSFHYTCVH